MKTRTKGTAKETKTANKQKMFVCLFIDGFMSGRCYFFTSIWMQQKICPFFSCPYKKELTTNNSFLDRDSRPPPPFFPLGDTLRWKRRRRNFPSCFCTIGNYVPSIYCHFNACSGACSQTRFEGKKDNSSAQKCTTGKTIISFQKRVLFFTQLSSVMHPVLY